jgi:predicted nucleic acid-binding protein
LSSVLHTAAGYPFQHLTTLDAVQLASAQSLGDALTQFITYDQRLAKSAGEIGLPVVTPGV